MAHGELSSAAASGHRAATLLVGASAILAAAGAVFLDVELVGRILASVGREGAPGVSVPSRTAALRIALAGLAVVATVTTHHLAGKKVINARSLAGLLGIVLVLEVALSFLLSYWNVLDDYDESTYVMNAWSLRGTGVALDARRPPLLSFLFFLAPQASWICTGLLHVAVAVMMSAWLRRWVSPVACLAAVTAWVLSDSGRHLGMQTQPAVLSGLGALGAVWAVCSRKWALAGFGVAMAVLARWNAAPLVFVLAIVVQRLGGWKPLLRYLVGGAVPAIAVALLALLTIPGVVDQVHSLFRLQLEHSSVPTTPERFLAYLKASYFVGPAGLVISLFLTWGGVKALVRGSDPTPTHGQICALAAVSYLLAMSFIGIPLARYTVTALPLVLVASAEGIDAIAARWSGGRAVLALALIASVLPTFFWVANAVENRASHYRDLPGLTDALETVHDDTPIYTEVNFMTVQATLGRPMAAAILPVDHPEYCVAYLSSSRWPRLKPEDLPASSVVITLDPDGRAVLARSGELYLVRGPVR